MIITCSHCGEDCEKTVGHINRALKLGSLLFCDRICFGLSSRKWNSEAEKKKQKKIYDQKYSKTNKDRIKSRMRTYNSSPAGRAMQKRNREKFKQAHLEYCRTPEYKKWKKDYDLKYRAKKNYGEYWQAFVFLLQIENEIEKRQVKQQLGLYNKSINRKRRYEKFKREELEKSTMGNPK